MKIYAFILLHILYIQTVKTEYVWTGTEWKWQEPGQTDTVIPGGDTVHHVDDEVEGTGDSESYDDEDYDEDYEYGQYDNNNNNKGGVGVDQTPFTDDEDSGLEGSGGGGGDVVPPYGSGEDYNVHPSGGMDNNNNNDKDHIYVDPYQPPDNFPKTDDEREFVFSETEPPPQTTRPTTTTTTTTTTRKPPPPPEGHDRGATNVPINRSTSFFAQPGILAAVIGGAVVGLLCAILLVMFIVYRMRKKDEGSYALDEPKRSPNVNSYSKPPSREFYA